MSLSVQHDADGAPVLVTGRLVLRKPSRQDWDSMARFWASDRSHRLCDRLGGGVDDAAPCPCPPPVRICHFDAGGRT